MGKEVVKNPLRRTRVELPFMRISHQRVMPALLNPVADIVFRSHPLLTVS